jgi:hypothetical protein
MPCGDLPPYPLVEREAPININDTNKKGWNKKESYTYTLVGDQPSKNQSWWLRVVG